jgi:hypothetical protein
MIDYSELSKAIRKEANPPQRTTNEVVELLYNAAEAIDQLIIERDEAIRSREHTNYFYACRLERLRQFAKDNGWLHEYSSIVANGTATVHEPPTYAQQLNMANYRAEKAELEIVKLKETINGYAKK